MGKYMIENGIKYELKDEQYYPFFIETNPTEHRIGKYEQLHLACIEQLIRGIYTTLLTERRLSKLFIEKKSEVSIVLTWSY